MCNVDIKVIIGFKVKDKKMRVEIERDDKIRREFVRGINRRIGEFRRRRER